MIKSTLNCSHFFVPYHQSVFFPLTIASEDNRYVLLGEGVDGEEHSRTLCGEEAKCHVVSRLAVHRG